MLRQENTSSQSGYSYGGIYTTDFTYGGAEPLAPGQSGQLVVGTTGTANLIILNTPFRQFNNWVCHQPEVTMLSTGAIDCDHFGGGDINATVLYRYLSAHQSEIISSRLIADQNVTLDYPIASTNVSIALTFLGSGVTKYYWRQTETTQTFIYPLIGYGEPSGAFWSLFNISYGLIAAGGAGLIVVLTRLNSIAPAPTISRGQIVQKCPQCGQQNLSFAEQCNNCGSALQSGTQRPEAMLH
jgi:hypothetical protein